MMGCRLRPSGVRLYSTRGGHLRVGLALHQTVFLHLPQLGGEHLLAHAGQRLFQLAETLGAGEQVPQDQHLPFVTDHGEGGFHRAGRQFLFGTHLSFLPSGPSRAVFSILRHRRGACQAGAGHPTHPAQKFFRSPNCEKSAVHRKSFRIVTGQKSPAGNQVTALCVLYAGQKGVYHGLVSRGTPRCPAHPMQ